MLMATNNSTTADTSGGEYDSVVSVLQMVAFGIGLFALISNGILILITILDPLGSFQKSSSYLILSLAVSDFITGITTCLYVFRDKISDKPLFGIIMSASIWVSIQNSVFIIFLMAVERFLVIKKPLKSRHIVTKGRTKILIAVAWVAAFALGCTTVLPLPYQLYAKLAFMVECLLLVLFMIFIYIKIVYLLRSSLNKFKGRKFCGRQSLKDNGDEIIKSREQRNLNIVVFSLAVILCVTVVPHWVIGFYYLGNEISSNGTWTKPPIMTVLPTITYTVELLNFALNPLVYAWRLPAYKQAVLYYVYKEIRYRRRSPSTSSNTVKMHDVGNHLVPKRHCLTI